MADQTFDNVKLKVSFTEATERENIVSGENISTSFGKISKVISDLEAGEFGDSATINEVEVTGDLDSVNDLKIAGKVVAGTEYTVNGTAYTAESGAEVHNSYTDNYGIGSNSTTFGWGNKNFADSGIIGGSQNTAYNTGAFVVGSSNNVGSSDTSGSYGYVFGSGNTISSTGSHNTAIGEQNTISGSSTRCVAMGQGNTISDTYATSTNTQSYGLGNTVSGELNFVRGFINNVKGKYTSVDGWNNTVTGGYCDRIEGYKNNISASGQYSHIEGNNHTISGQYQNTHVEGNNNSIKNTVNGIHVEGAYNTINGECDQISVSGTNNTLSGMCNSGSTINGSYNTINGCWSTYVGGANNSVSLLGQGFVHGYNLLVNGSHNSTTFGKNNVEDTAGDYCLVIGNGESASARSNALAVTWDGEIESATGKVLSSNDFTDELKTKLDGITTATINDVEVTGDLDSATNLKVAGKIVAGTEYTVDGTTYTAGEGAEVFNNYRGNVAVGDYSHAEGIGTIAFKHYSHAEGYHTKTLGYSSHAEGNETIASGGHSHAEGSGTTASATCAHAEGSDTIASAMMTHAGGYCTIAASYCQTAIGRYNIEDSSDKYAFIIGNGNVIDGRSNALAVTWDGEIESATGKVLSSNDFTDEEKTKLTSITNPMVIKGTVASATELPTTAEIGWIYFVGADGSSEYDEYVYTEGGTWELIGHTTIDMSGYVQTTDIATATNVGLVKPDGVTLTTNADGVLSAVTGTEDEIDAMFADADWEY